MDSEIVAQLQEIATLLRRRVELAEKQIELTAKNIELANARYAVIDEIRAENAQRAEAAKQAQEERKRRLETTPEERKASNDEWQAEKNEEKEFKNTLVSVLRRHNELLEALLKRGS